MRPDLTAPDGLTRVRAPTFTVYPIAATPRQLLLGTAASGVSFTNYVTAISQDPTSAQVDITIPSTFTQANIPVPGRVCSIADDGVVVFNGVVDSVARTEGVGERSLSITIRRRDTSPYWRDVRRVSQAYLGGIRLGAIARDVASQAGLQTDEYDLPAGGVIMGHTQRQFADVPLWEMLRSALEPMNLEPFVDARGFLKTISRNVLRVPDYVLTGLTGVRGESSSVTTAPLTAVRVKYVDVELERAPQERRVLASGTVEKSLDAWNSLDRWSTISWAPVRADNVELKRIDFDERLSAKPEISTSSLFECEIEFPAPVEGSEALHYEIWGDPYDYVEQVNECEVYDSTAPAWASARGEITNSLISSEAVAVSLATSELFYQISAAGQATLTLGFDDYRYEPGDIIAMPDGRKFYIMTYSRDLSPGVVASVELGGFFAGGSYQTAIKW